MLSKKDSECSGCFNSKNQQHYGSCEGCVGILSFQTKCFNILKKAFKVENRQVYQQEANLNDEDKEFLKELLTYLNNGDD